jgi:hypothetical protein
MILLELDWLVVPGVEVPVPQNIVQEAICPFAFMAG